MTKRGSATTGIGITIRRLADTSRPIRSSSRAVSTFIDLRQIRCNVKTQPNTAFFWSGRTEGVGGMDSAAAIAKANGGTTLEMLLEERKIKMPNWDASNPTVVNEWGQISKAYAQGACGLVRGVIGMELRPGNVWEGYEKGALMNNQNVKAIQTIDPKTGALTTIFQR